MNATDVKLKHIAYQLDRIERVLLQIIRGEVIILGTQKVEAATLTAIAGHLSDVGDQVAALETAVNNLDNTSPEVDAALEALKTSVTKIDTALAPIVPPPSDSSPAPTGDTPAPTGDNPTTDGNNPTG